MQISTKQMQAYGEDGYIVLRDFITPAQQERVLLALRRLILGQVGFFGIARNLPEPPRAIEDFFGPWMEQVEQVRHDVIRASYHTIFDTLALQTLYWDPRLLQVIGQLIDVPAENLFLNSNRLRIDPPHPSPIRLGWHQESSYTRSRSRCLQVWGPLIWPSSIENGSIEIVPGSHRDGNIPTALANPGQPGSQQFLIPEDRFKHDSPMLVEINPGDLVVFSCDLIHRSHDPAQQKRMKYSLLARYSDYTSPAFSPFGPVI